MSNVELTISAGEPKEPSGFKLVATLGLAGMISGLGRMCIRSSLIASMTLEATSAGDVPTSVIDFRAPAPMAP